MLVGIGKDNVSVSHREGQCVGKRHSRGYMSEN